MSGRLPVRWKQWTRARGPTPLPALPRSSIPFVLARRDRRLGVGSFASVGPCRGVFGTGADPGETRWALVCIFPKTCRPLSITTAAGAGKSPATEPSTITTQSGPGSRARCGDTAVGTRCRGVRTRPSSHPLTRAPWPQATISGQAQTAPPFRIAVANAPTRAMRVQTNANQPSRSRRYRVPVLVVRLFSTVARAWHSSTGVLHPVAWVRVTSLC